MKRTFIIALIAFAVVGHTACDKKRDMVTQTYELTRLKHDDAVEMLTPYIREGGYISGKDKLISVTERPDRQKVIADLLKKYDGGGEAIDITLDVQVIAADGYEQSDSAIADVEGQLRELFRYRGYKLIGSTRIQTREDEVFMQSTEQFSVSGKMQRVRGTAADRRIAIAIELQTGKTRMMSTVTATLGKPTVIGQAGASGGAIILVIRPSA